jgi:ABC-type branched-subunit amino acid transport system substrate-binding protein
MVTIQRRERFSICVAILVLFSLVCIVAGDTESGGDEPVYIGVLLPLTGPDGKPMLDALNLCTEQINAGGGINGHPVRLILRDTRTGDIQTYAVDLANDKRIRVVVGPYTSDELFRVSSLFINNDKVLVSPTASSDNIFRGFGTSGYVWRTITSDGIITSVMIQHLLYHNATSVALLTPNTTYGETFWDWIPYWALETGITITGAEEFSDTNQIPPAVKNLTAHNPDYLIFIHAENNEEILSALRTLHEQSSKTNLSLVYPGVDTQAHLMERMNTSSLFSSLISGQWILQNSTVSETQLPDNTLLIMAGAMDEDFIHDFETSSGTKPTGFAPHTYDALLVASGIMSRFLENPDKSPKNAARTIFSDGSAEPQPRTIDGFQSAFTSIMNNETTVITGSTGPLIFRPEGTDLLTPRYDTYQVADGKLIQDRVIFHSIHKTESFRRDLSDGAPPVGSEVQPFSPDNFWAVIGALSHDWENYRHQADALTIYQSLKKQGVPDDHIILLVYDDIPVDKRNIKPGEVYHTPGEIEVRRYAYPDYIGDKVNKQTLKDVLFGRETYGDTPVLQSDENSTVLVYLSSHGAKGGNMILGEKEEFITPGEFQSIIQEMSEQKKFGRMLVVLESCFSGATAAGIDIPGVVILTAASEDETSKAATYDSGLSNWISDEFTNQIVSLLSTGDKAAPLREFYQEIYMNVRSSHPMMIRGDISLGTPTIAFFGGTGR